MNEEIEIRAISKLELKPGDTLVIYVSCYVQKEELERFKKKLESQYPDQKILIVNDDVIQKLEVIAA